MRSLAAASAALLVALAVAPASAAEPASPPMVSPHATETIPDRRLTPPDLSPGVENPQPYPTLLWLALQALPSPEVAVGKDTRVEPPAAPHEETVAAFGLRWQLTPILWSWGLNRKVDRWRFFVVDPIARVSGSLSFETHLEYIGGYVDRVLVRPAVKATFPLLQRGEYLSASIGTSVYQYDERARIAYDVGLYVLGGTLGIQAAIAPNHAALSSIGTLRIRFF